MQRCFNQNDIPNFRMFDSRTFMIRPSSPRPLPSYPAVACYRIATFHMKDSNFERTKTEPHGRCDFKNYQVTCIFFRLSYEVFTQSGLSAGKSEGPSARVNTTLLVVRQTRDKTSTARSISSITSDIKIYEAPKGTINYNMSSTMLSVIQKFYWNFI